MKKIIVGLTGASGSAYFLRLIEVLLEYQIEIHVIASEHGSQVLTYETGVILEEQIKAWNKKTSDTTITLEDNNNMFSAVASGSYRVDGMIIIPCSMSSMAEIANGVTKSLLTRAADVMIKEQRKLVIVPRETPLSTIHLKNMYELSKIGVTILPAMPGFYNHPETLEDIINHIVGKALDCIGIDNNNYKRWKGSN